ncbi:MAG: DUF418 domain-containing protein [Myxococcota bacterium]
MPVPIAAPLTAPRPTPSSQRIAEIDFLRGVAVLGILIMNVQIFAMPHIAYVNPTTFGDLTGSERWAWWLSYTFADRKFMNLFSMLFGAGLILMNQRQEQKKLPGTMLHYRRMLWLLGIGLCHSYLIWYGDILVTYALCGSLVYLARNLQPRLLIVLGILLLTVPSVSAIQDGTKMRNASLKQRNDIAAQLWSPPHEIIDHEVQTYRSGWLEQMHHRFPEALNFQIFVFAYEYFWRVSALMLLGMALFKLNILGGSATLQVYRGMLLGGLVIGLPLVVYGQSPANVRGGNSSMRCSLPANTIIGGAFSSAWPISARSCSRLG